MVLHIKNMVCDRCKMVVKSRLESLGLHPVSVELGEVTLADKPENVSMDAIRGSLEAVGFMLLDDRKGQIIEKVKKRIIEWVQGEEADIKTNLSDYLTAKLPHSYSYISSLFAEVEGTTIERYAITQKIERVKELIVYDELTLSEIAFRMGYSSVAHLSNQFKKVTGFSPSHFKNIREIKRKPLDQL